MLAACTTGESPTPDASSDASSPTLAIEPADIALESIDGAQPTATFTASAAGAPVEVDWTLAHDRVGAIVDGVFTASGRAGGEVEVRARLGASTATARVTVRIVRTATGSVPSEIPPLFDSLPSVEDPFEAASIVYPLEGARMPNNAGAPDVQWLGPSEIGDAYRVVLESRFARVTGFTHHATTGFGSRVAIDRDSFRAMADSARSESVSVRVERLPAARDRVVRGAPVSFWLSEDGIFGTLYYWQVATDPQASDVYRIDAATSTRSSVFATRPGSCVGCHALSSDGRRLAATLDSRGPDWVTAIVDATSAEAPPPDLATFDPAFNFFAFSPDGTRMLGSRPLAGDADDTRLVLLDEDGLPIAEPDLPTAAAGYPAWSPDGSLVAFMEGGGDGPRGTDEATRIAIASVRDGGLENARVLHDGATLEDSLEGGLTDSRPTFSPDSRWVAFAHGTRSVSAVGSGAERPRAAIYLVSVDDPTRVVRLDRGMGRNGPVDAFWPVFSPFATEEPDGTKLYWLAFYSRQDYGNERSGTRGSGRRQLWVMAIDPTIAATGDDPSHPPYWLAGQDVRADDIAAQWARTACRAQGDDCSASSECCSGKCGSGPDPVCEPPDACRRYGESCETAADCCIGLECNLGVCGYEPPI